MENWQESGSTRQGSLETSSGQQLGLKLKSAESYSLLSISGQQHVSRNISPDDSSSGQELAAQLQNSSFGSEQVRSQSLHQGSAVLAIPHLKDAVALPRWWLWEVLKVWKGSQHVSKLTGGLSGSRVLAV